MWLLAVALASAAITVERTPSKLEKNPPKDPGAGGTASAIEAYGKARDLWDRAVAAVERTDGSARWLLGEVEDCYVRAGGKGGRVVGRLVVGINATVRSVVIDKEGDAALGACVRSTFDKRAVAAMPWRDDVELDWALTATGADPLPNPPALDRDAGVGGVAFGATIADLGSTMLVKSTNLSDWYARQMDNEARWLGVQIEGAQYGFADVGLFGAVIVFAGKERGFAVRQALKDRYGQPRWDPTLKSFYWRGQVVVINVQDIPDADKTMVTILDAPRARTAKAAGRLPGDPPPEAQAAVPSILMQ